MSATQSKITRQANNQENVTHNKEKRSINGSRPRNGTNSRTKTLIDKDIKTVVCLRK